MDPKGNEKRRKKNDLNSVFIHRVEIYCFNNTFSFQND